MKNWRDISKASFVLAVGFFFIAILSYNGSSFDNLVIETFRWKSNFLSDLGQITWENGLSSPLTRSLFIASMSATCLSLATFSLSQNKRSWPMIISAFLSGALLVATAAIPSEVHNTAHRLVMLLAYIGLLICWLIYTKNLQGSQIYSGIANSIVLISYLLFIIIAPRPDFSDQFALIHAQVQKAVVLIFSLIFGFHIWLPKTNDK